MDSKSRKSRICWQVLLVLGILLLTAILYRGYAVISLDAIDTPTQVAPSEEAVILEIVDASRASVTLPVRERLLVRACEKDTYDRCHSYYEAACETPYKCEIGLLDPENSQFLRLYSFTEEADTYAKLAWSPDGTQLVYYCGGPNSGSFTILHADSSAGLSLGEFYSSYAFWSPDGRYLVVKTVTGSNSTPTSGYTVYDAGSWQAICRVASCQYCNTPASSIGLGGQCELSAGDAHTLVLEGYFGQSRVSIMLCNPQGVCVDYPDKEDAINNWSYREQTQHKYYLAKIENYWLRLIDIITGLERTYVIPDYRITNATWTPD